MDGGEVGCGAVLQGHQVSGVDDVGCGEVGHGVVRQGPARGNGYTAKVVVSGTGGEGVLPRDVGFQGGGVNNVGCEDVCQEPAKEQVYTARMITATGSKSSVKCVRRGRGALHTGLN